MYEKTRPAKQPPSPQHHPHINNHTSAITTTHHQQHQHAHINNSIVDHSVPQWRIHTLQSVKNSVRERATLCEKFFLKRQRQRGGTIPSDANKHSHSHLLILFTHSYPHALNKHIDIHISVHIDMSHTYFAFLSCLTASPVQMAACSTVVVRECA
jgi:hypothetical protein